MSGRIKWKKALFSTLAVGIIGWSIYGVYHTVNAYYNIQQSQTSSDTLTSDATVVKNNPDSSGSFCNPLGYANCRGCTSLLYQQNIETLPGADIQIERLN
jgi:hypothetical protein